MNQSTTPFNATATAAVTTTKSSYSTMNPSSTPSAKSLAALLSLLLVIPASCAYLISIIMTLHPQAMIPSSMLLTWCMIELLFYCHFVYNRNRLQRHIKPDIPLTKEQRTSLFWNCLHTVKDVKSWSEGWFYFEKDFSRPSANDIKRDNFAVWFAWAFWHDQLDTVRQNKEWNDEIEWMMDTAQEWFQHRFEHGFNDQIKCLRLNLDPVAAVHRPLFVYLVLYVISTLFNEIFLHWIWNFKHEHVVEVWGNTMKYVDGCYYTIRGFFFPSIINSSNSNNFETKKLKKKPIISYYYKQPVETTTSTTTTTTNENTNKNTPIVFIHGIGAGLMCYVEFVHRLCKLNRPLFLVELPYVSMRMVDNVPTAQETVQGISEMLHEHGFEKAVFVSHSLGTGTTSWVMNIKPELVAGSVLIDPICFLLHYHHVAFNFVYRIPINLVEHIMHYGVARELYISNFISRHFQWYESIYFVRNTPTAEKPTFTSLDGPMKNTSVFLSEFDRIVGSDIVLDYLKERNVESHVMSGLEHAGFIMSTKWKDIIVKQVEHVASKIDY